MHTNTSKSMNQSDAVLRELRKGPITPLEALSRVGSLRLAARVLELRQRGHEIHTQRVDRGGRRVARYVLVKEARR